MGKCATESLLPARVNCFIDSYHGRQQDVAESTILRKIGTKGFLGNQSSSSTTAMLPPGNHFDDLPGFYRIRITQASFRFKEIVKSLTETCGESIEEILAASRLPFFHWPQTRGAL
jgi:hypothetical protein